MDQLFDILPDNLHLLICSFMTTNTLIKYSRVNEHFNIISSDILWYNAVKMNSNTRDLQIIKKIRNSYNDKRRKYIKNKQNNNINEIDINTEINDWKNLFTKYLQENFVLYVKGGYVLGIQILKMLKEKILQNNDMFYKIIKMNLLQDVDFTLFSAKAYNEVVSMAKPNFRREGSTICILRHNNYVQVGEKSYDKNKNPNALFELNVESKHINNISNPLSPNNIEIPMTAMTLQLTTKNIQQFMDFALIIYRNIPYKNIINEIYEKIDYFEINIPDSINGFLKLEEYQVINCINKRLNNIIYNVVLSVGSLDVDQNKYGVIQFLISHIKQPTQLMRFIYKNIPKAYIIEELFEENNIQIPNWLIISHDQCILLITELLTKIKLMIDNIFVNWNKYQHLYYNNANNVRYKEHLLNILDQSSKIFDCMNLRRLNGFIKFHRFDETAKPILQYFVPSIDPKFLYKCKINKRNKKYVKLIKYVYGWK